MRRQYIVTYDICDPKRLRMTYKIMRNYGDHLQLSVFTCQLSAMERIRLEEELRDVIHAKEDQVLFIDLGLAKGAGPARVTALGRRYQPSSSGAVVV